MTRLSHPLGIAFWVPDAWRSWTANGIEYRRDVRDRIYFRTIGAVRWAQVIHAGMTVQRDVEHPLTLRRAS